ncbi:hypothetical protein BCD64_02455 [Nostoc sp. MBR 210]|uniref:Uncharacterized protein n=1 Tax=Nostoc spongiaeforme FACHB-130 TaxID=1357510 RepID=A0ABR8G3F3_9NOSO|nr:MULTISPECIES: hypothetical protein [Nostoc]MBD2497746.1 hypothetical protein [Nostoc sp. FACHB-280]MBD2597670.1 hypothetical protein [Nostoc spongiaeforme FACHB-130]OCQ99962.1 hypothetical protein BCD64_02455 [Nostoc sp. MBR 210]
MTEERQAQYFDLIDQLLQCPNGQEPAVLEANSELVDANLIEAMAKVATMFAHDGNQDGAKFLFHVARELAKQLGLYPDFNNSEAAKSE